MTSKCLSEEQLAEFSGLSIRTIQQIERSQNPALDSWKSLTAVFEVRISNLQQTVPENDMYKQKQITNDNTQSIQYLHDIKSFYSHLFKSMIAITLQVIVN